MSDVFRMLGRGSVAGVTLLVGTASSLMAQPVSRTGGPRAGIDVESYHFQVDFPATGYPESLRFVSNVTVLRTAATAALSLDLVAALTVDSAHVNGARVAFTRPGDSVRVALPGGVGDTVRVAVFYHGRPTDGLILRRDSVAGWTAFGDNFPNRARQWLATVDHPADKALVEWTVRAPASHRVIANGALVEETAETAGPVSARVVRTVWRTQRPIYTAVMVIGVAPFAVVELGETACGLGELPGCVQQSVWTRPEQRGAVPGGFVDADGIVSWFSKTVGPFPYEKLAHVASSTRYGGMENAAAIFYADQLFRNGTPREALIAHETAHQWFGDAVTEREWPHVWLSEGFATYFAALWLEHAHGDSVFRPHMEAMRAKVIRAPITAQVPVINDALDDVARVLNSNVYEKAGFVLHMLRREIGDSAFFGAIRSYYATHRHGNAMTADLQREFEKTAGQPLDWFFTQWLTRTGTATLQPSWTWNAAQRQVLVTVRQPGTAEPYRLSMHADVTDAAGTVQRLRIAVPAQRSATITLPVTLGARPRSLVFDPDVSVLGTIATP